MKNYIGRLLVMCVAVVIFSQCSDGNPGSWVPIGDYLYPLKIGNSWKYTHDYSTTNFRPFSGHSDSTFDHVHYNSTVQVNVDRTELILDSVSTFVLRTFETQNNMTQSSEVYFKNTSDGLYNYGYRYSPESILLPKLHSKILYHANGKEYSSLGEIFISLSNDFFNIVGINSDSLVINDPPRQTLKYPMEIGVEWILVDEIIAITKKVIGKEYIELPSGIQECYKIQWRHYNHGGWDENIIFYDYFSHKGLVKRTIEYNNIGVSSSVNPDGYGLVDAKEEIVLTGSTIN